MNITQFAFNKIASPYEFKPFNCNDRDLNDFLITDSKKFLADLLAVTYVIESDSQTVAFFSLSNDKISIKDFKDNGIRWKNFMNLKSSKSLSSFPAIKIGRLAVDCGYQGNRIGAQILDYIKGMSVDNTKTACKFITVDAYKDSLGFYEKNDFKFLTEKDVNKDTRQMYFDLLPYSQL